MSETEYLFPSNKKLYNSINTTSRSNIVMTTAKEVKYNKYHIHWRLHFYWTLAVICFIIGKLWYLVPLPGAQILPPYRTYPANFLDTIFLTIGGALAARSVVIGLVKSFAEGIYPESIVTFGSTGGFAAMWSCIKHRSGLRYFLIAMLVTGCTLVGSALQGELQSTLHIYYRTGDPTSANMLQCSHASPKDFTLASSAYSSGLITHTLSDAASLLNSLNSNNYQPMKSFSISLIKTTLTPIQNVTFLPPQSGTTRVLRRHYIRSSTTTSVSSTQTQQQKQENTSSPCKQDEDISTEPNSSNNEEDNNASISGIDETTNNEDTNLATGVTQDSCNDSSTIMNNNNTSMINNGNNSNNDGKDLNNNGQSNSNLNITTTITSPVKINDSNTSLIISSAAVAYAESLLSFNSSKLTIIRNDVNNRTALPFLLDQTYNTTSDIPIKLNVFRYSTPDNKNAVIVYSSLANGYNYGVYVNAEATNYTCQQQSRGGSVMCDEGNVYTADSKVIADAMVTAIQSGEGLYGTNSVNGLTLDIVNGVDSTGKQSKLVDALFTNPYCSNSALSPGEGLELFPYSVGELTPLAILWLAIFFILWLIGVYLIGYSEHTWTKLAATGSLVSQIISKSPNMFENNDLAAKPVKQEMFLDPEEGKMNFDKNYRHGYTVTTAEVD